LLSTSQFHTATGQARAKLEFSRGRLGGWILTEHRPELHMVINEQLADFFQFDRAQHPLSNHEGHPAALKELPLLYQSTG
jgi:hypothetical protein